MDHWEYGLSAGTSKRGSMSLASVENVITDRRVKFCTLTGLAKFLFRFDQAGLIHDCIIFACEFVAKTRRK